MSQKIHQIILATHALLQKKIRTEICSKELPPGQPKILEFLNKNEGCEQKNIAKGCFLNPSSVTGILGRMEKKNLIKREQKENNRRSIYVYLTPKGRESALKNKKEIEKIENKILKNITETEKEQLIKILNKLKISLEEE